MAFWVRKFFETFGKRAPDTYKHYTRALTVVQGEKRRKRVVCYNNKVLLCSMRLWFDLQGRYLPSYSSTLR